MLIASSETRRSLPLEALRSSYLKHVSPCCLLKMFTFLSFGFSFAGYRLPCCEWLLSTPKVIHAAKMFSIVDGVLCRRNF